MVSRISTIIEHLTGTSAPAPAYPQRTSEVLDKFFSIYSSNPVMTAAMREQFETEQPWKRNLRNVEDACYDVDPKDIEGEIPADFEGTYFANGPGRIGVERSNGDTVLFGHWFDSDGRIIKLTFKDGQVSFMCKTLETKRFLAQKGHDYVNVGGGWTLANQGKPFSNILRQPLNNANTSVMHIGDRVFALAEGGLPLEFNPKTLGVMSSETFGKLKRTDTFSAHYKMCPKTGDIYCYGMNFVDFGIAMYHISATGQGIKRSFIPLDYLGFVHDFVLSDNYMVFIIPPFVFSKMAMAKVVGGLKSVGECLEWKPELGSKVIVVNRNDFSVVNTFTIEPITNYHYGNVVEIPGSARVRMVIGRQMDRELFEKHIGLIYMADFRAFAPGALWEVELDITKGKMTALTPLSRTATEFPTFNTNLQGQTVRYHYASSLADLSGGFFNGIEKIDAQHERGQVVIAPEGCFLLEPLFVPRANCQDEEDGYLVVGGFDSKKAKSFYVIMDARTLQTLARINLRQPHGYTFHGLFMPNRYF